MGSIPRSESDPKKVVHQNSPHHMQGNLPHQPTNQPTTSFEKRTFGTLQLAASNLAGRQYLHSFFKLIIAAPWN